MNKLATILLCINFITVLFPQPGYIHPDEFFQSSEIVAGDVFGVQHFRAWEFEPSFPVRSIVFPYLVTGPSMYFLRWINSTNIQGLKISATKVVMATRLPVAFLSVFGYLATSRLAKTFGADEYLSCILWCSYYVTWAYFTRTFSNTVEAVLLSMVLLLILSSESLKSKTLLDKNKETPKPLYSKDGSMKEESPKKGQKSSNPSEGREKKKKKAGKEKIKSSPNVKTPWLRSFFLGLLIVAGFFNRPTFLTFIVIPVLFWLHSVKTYYFKGRSIFKLFGVCLSMSFGAVLTFCAFVVADTLYFNADFKLVISTTLHNLFDTKSSFNVVSSNLKDFIAALTITPWNFVQYNLKTENLAQHGIHPRYTHFFVNIPLLTGPLCIPILLTSAVSILKLFSTRSITRHFHNTMWLTGMVFIPTLVLSVFPHQEPRFLIPLMPVLVILGAKFLEALGPAKLSFFALWTVFNVLLGLVYGYLHQGALIPALSIYSNKLSSPSGLSSQHHIIFYKTYPPPQHLFLVQNKSSYLKAYDLAGAPVETVAKTIKSSRSKCLSAKKKCQIYIFMPSTVTPRVMDELSSHTADTTSICPHISMEAPPRFRAWWANRISSDEFMMDFCLNVLRIS